MVEEEEDRGGEEGEEGGDRRSEFLSAPHIFSKFAEAPARLRPDRHPAALLHLLLSSPARIGSSPPPPPPSPQNGTNDCHSFPASSFLTAKRSDASLKESVEPVFCA